MMTSSIWVVDPSGRAITSGILEEQAGSPDRITLFVHGEPLPVFEVPAGVGPQFLVECGLKKAPRP